MFNKQIHMQVIQQLIPCSPTIPLQRNNSYVQHKNTNAITSIAQCSQWLIYMRTPCIFIMERISKYLPCWMPIHRIAIEEIKKHPIALDTYHIPLPSENLKHHIETHRMSERVLRKRTFHWFISFLKATNCVSVVQKHSKAIWSIICRHPQCLREFYENRLFIESYYFYKAQSVWVLSENTPKPSEASYPDKQNVWEEFAKPDFSLLLMIWQKHKVCECCPKTHQSHLKHHNKTSRKCERGLRKSIFHRFSSATSHL